MKVESCTIRGPIHQYMTVVHRCGGWSGEAVVRLDWRPLEYDHLAVLPRIGYGREHRKTEIRRSVHHVSRSSDLPEGVLPHREVCRHSSPRLIHPEGCRRGVRTKVLIENRGGA